MLNLRDFTHADLLKYFTERGERPYRAEQVYSWVFKRGVETIDEMTDVSKALREKLKVEFYVGKAKVLDVLTSKDGTQKFLSELADGARIESVIIPEDDRVTLCVSTQAGCALGCRFCLTGTSGFTRNLTLAELTGQVFSAKKILADKVRLTNIVMMGMGEPLNNYENVMRFAAVLTDGKAFGVSHNKVTISTAGVVPAIKTFMDDTRVNLAVSLNATTDEVRTRLMPINKKYPLEELMSALKVYSRNGRKHVTIEYVMIKGVNDTLDDVARLVKMLRNIQCKVNLIPFNAFEGSEFKSPDNERVQYFHKMLLDDGYTVIVRSSKGGDILAACGQLKGAYDG